MKPLCSKQVAGRRYRIGATDPTGRVPIPRMMVGGEGVIVAASGPFGHCDCRPDHDIIDDGTFAIFVEHVDLQCDDGSVINGVPFRPEWLV